MNAPDLTTLQIKANGVIIPREDMTFDKEANEVRFTEQGAQQLKLGDEIQVRMIQKTSLVLLALSIIAMTSYSYGSETPVSSQDAQWEDWANSQVSQTENVTVQNRMITKSGRFQIC